MPFSGTGQGGQEYLAYRVRAFLDQIAGLDRLPAEASFAGGLHNLRIQEAVVQAAVTGSAVEVEAHDPVEDRDPRCCPGRR
jgi:predicted dehydrogenase